LSVPDFRRKCRRSYSVTRSRSPLLRTRSFPRGKVKFVCVEDIGRTTFDDLSGEEILRYAA